MPMQKWVRANHVQLRSARSGRINLNNFALNPNDNYRVKWDKTGNRIDYHINRPLTTVDRDNDEWSDNCARYGQTFGWYGACCHLCMTTGEGGWPGSSTPYMPSDWNYLQTDTLEFWGKFKRPAKLRNKREEALATCKEIRDNDTTAISGYYWLHFGTNGTYAVECDMSTDGGGWTKIYGNYSGEASSTAWYKPGYGNQSRECFWYSSCRR